MLKSVSYCEEILTNAVVMLMNSAESLVTGIAAIVEEAQTGQAVTGSVLPSSFL